MFSIPEGMTESELLTLMDEIILKFKQKYTFRGYDSDDISQECYIMMAKALPKFDPERGKLEHFLTNHLLKRLINLKRDKYARPRTATENKRKVNTAINFGVLKADSEKGLSYQTDFDFVDNREFLENLKKYLKKDSILILNKILDNGRVTNYKQKALVEEIREIVKQHPEFSDIEDI